MGFRSYAEQAAHYFHRPHVDPVTVPLSGPASWAGNEMVRQTVWRTPLVSAQVEELRNALRHAKATGKPTGDLTAADFPLPALSAEIARWRSELTTGRGFHVVAGVPVDSWSQAESEIVFWCLGLHMGRPGAQNPQGDLLGHVVDTGDRADDPYVRLYRTTATIAYHCDAADVVGLLCLRGAKRGGASRIVSSVTVYNRLLQRRPALVGRLYEPFLLDLRNEDTSGGLRYVPIAPCCFDGSRLRTFYHSDYFRSVTRHPDVAPFTTEERDLLDLYEELAADPDLYLDMQLERGDIQWLSNHTILHARTEYEDNPEPEGKRHLLRLWLSID